MRFGKTDIELGKIGLGCWAIGGIWRDLNANAGWGDVDDDESLRALHAGLDAGARFLDTANIYGCGHSERVVGKAVKGHRDQVILSTKFGILCDEEKKETIGQIESEEDIMASCEQSLRRLDTDYIDILLFHLGDFPLERVDMVLEALEKLVDQGKIRAYGWSTADPERARRFAQGFHCGGFMHVENIMEDDAAMLDLCEELGMTSIGRTPLCMGLLTGKYDRNTVFAKGDLRGKDEAPPWMTYYIDGKPNEVLLKKLNSVREILTSDGRTLAQGCLAWIWARSNKCIPIPGFRTEKQVRENVAALEKGPLTQEKMQQIEMLLKDI